MWNPKASGEDLPFGRKGLRGVGLRTGSGVAHVDADALLVGGSIFRVHVLYGCKMLYLILIISPVQ